MSSLAIVTRFHHLNEPAQNEEKLHLVQYKLIKKPRNSKYNQLPLQVAP